MGRTIFDDIKDIIIHNEDDYLNLKGEHRSKIVYFLENPNESSANELFEFIGVMHKKREFIC